MTVRILVGDVLTRLAELPDESVHCVVTSPPYWGLRDYGVPGQMGLERTLGEHLEVMVRVFREVRRVLRADGTLWVNYGDCYAASVNGRSAADTKALGNDDRTFRDKPFSTIGPIYASDQRDEDRRGNHSTLSGGAPVHTPGRILAGGILKPKDLCMIPNRFAIAMQDDGWWVRSEIVWAKPNPMPESTRDRPTSAHEKVWLFTKSARYFYDAEAVRTPPKPETVARTERQIRNQGDESILCGGAYAPPGQYPNSKARRSDKQRGYPGRTHQGFNDRWDAMERAQQIADGANLRNVWTIATSAFPEAHFATFPPALPERCIKAGTSERGCCPHCGAPWVREVDVDYVNPGNRTTNGPRSLANRAQSAGYAVRRERRAQTVDWKPTCKCPAHAPVACTVLDPFAGSGTTGLVADRLGRDSILIELNPDYAEMARRRIVGAAPLLTRLTIEQEKLAA